MILNLERLLLGDIVRLRYVPRYSNCRRDHEEVVAEHSYFTVLYAWAIGEWAERNDGIPLLWSKLMARSVCHDIEEAISGDFPRPFKYSSSELRQMLDDAGREAAARVTYGIFPGERNLALEAWQVAKDRTREGRIVDFADFLSVVSYMLQELDAGNQAIHEHSVSIGEYFERFKDARFDFIRPLVLQCEPLVAEILDAESELRQRRDRRSLACQSAAIRQGTGVRDVAEEP